MVQHITTKGISSIWKISLEKLTDFWVYITYNFMKHLVTPLHQSTHNAWWSHHHPLASNSPHAYSLIHISAWIMLGCCASMKGHQTQGCYEQKNSGQLDANRSGRSHLRCTTSKKWRKKCKSFINLLFTFFSVALAATGIHIWRANFLL